MISGRCFKREKFHFLDDDPPEKNSFLKNKPLVSVFNLLYVSVLYLYAVSGYKKTSFSCRDFQVNSLLEEKPTNPNEF